MSGEIGANSIRNYRRIRRTIYDPHRDDLIPNKVPCSNCGENCSIAVPCVKIFAYPKGDPRIQQNNATFEKHTSYWCFDCVRSAPIENDKRVTNISVSE